MTRRGFIQGLLATTLAGLFVAAYGFFVEPSLRLRVRKWRVRRKDWTAQPLRIAVLSDLHVGEPYVGLDRVRQVVRRTNALAPDLILLLGDYAGHHKVISDRIEADELAPVLAGLEAKNGVYAVLGNHDWWDDRDAQSRGAGPNKFAAAFGEHGIRVLSNEAIRLDGPEIWLAGLEDQLAFRRNGKLVGLDDLPGTLAQVTDDAPVVMMAHEPDIFPKIPNRVALTLSGHTHGGQVRLFGWSPMVPSKYGNRYAYGHVREDGRDLVVSGGIGCSILPVRFGVTPEITVIELSA
ncbi:phosphodiesterase YaeI [Ruegeria denitrificans]|uniref:Phosphodiesterase YaeI n=1 Tax=Ruegeria denitrificans TaxID=1715692 RepID=A0A0P1I4N1_9RHOB|nr:metallophosphoesterase [Ruegeria denitrificans]CUJ89633.1 phosphodiesterase YaeI [Ruegeria denitrificans]